MSTTTFHRDWIFRVVVPGLIITSLAGAIRLSGASEPLWLDELHTAWIVGDSISEIAPRAAIGNQSPLYFYFVWFSVQLFGLNEVAIRLPSILCGTLLVAVVFGATFSWTRSSVAASLTSALVAIDSDCFFYAQEARPYVALQLAGLIQVFAFSKLMCDDSSPAQRRGLRIVFALSGLAVFYLHYTGALLFGAFVLCYAMVWLWKRKMPSYSCRTFAIDLSILALLILPAASHMSEIGGRRDDWISIVESWPTLGMMRFVEVYFLAATIGLISVLVVHVRMRRSLFRPLFVHYLFLIACWCAVPILLAWSATVFKIAPLAMLRYVVVSILAPIVYVGFCCAMIDSTRLRAMFATFILFVAVSTCSILYSWQMHGRLDVRRSENWPRVVELVNADKACEHWPVYVGAGLIEDHVLAQKHTKAFHRYCLFPVMSIYRIDGEHREIEPFPIFYAVQNWTAFESTLPGIRKRMKRSGGAWFVLRQDKQGARQLAELIANELGAEVEVVFASRSLNLIKIVQR